MNEGPSKTRISWDAWQRDLRSIGFANPLLNFDANTFSQIDLQRAHPSGISQLNASGRSVLSNLFRDPLAFSRAYSAAKRIKDHAEHLESQQGIQALAMVSGLVNLGHHGFDLALPILIWPVHLNRKVDDFELLVDPVPEVNPGLVDAIEQASGVTIDQQELLRKLSGTADFLPVVLLENLNHQVAGRIDLDITRVVSVGNFAKSLVTLSNDFQPRETPLLRKLAGLVDEEQSRSDIHGSDSPALDPVVNSSEDAALVLDADSTQRRIIRRAVAGESFAVETLPGCGYTQTLVNLLAALAERGLRVAVVAPRRQTLNEISERFASLGLGGLAVRGHNTWFDVISSISRNEKAKPSNFDIAKVRYEAASAEIEKYFELLVSEDSKFGVTLTEALEELAKLSILPKAPKTNARIPKANLLELRERGEALVALYEAKELGELDVDAGDSLWFQARFADQAEADRILKDVTRLANQTLPALREQIDAFIAKAHFKPGSTVEDWGNYLRLFLGIRDTLARFNTDVFSRPLDDLIVATGPRHGEVKMSGSNRRRLKKVAKEFVRPGMSVSDMHQALTLASEQRKLWSDYSSRDSQPEVPAGINDAMVSYQALISDLSEIQAHLDNQEDSPILTRMPLDDLASSLDSMAANSKLIETIEQRNQVRARLKQLGLNDLARNLASIKPAREQLALELELAWWQSVLEYLISRDPRVMSYSRQQIDSLEDDFKTADRTLVSEGAADLAWKASVRWKDLLSQYSAEAANLRATLQNRSASLRQINAAAPNIAEELLGVVLLSPYEAAELIDSAQNFDTVVIADAAGTTVGDNLSVLRRANQVIAFGDPAIGAPDGFTIEVQEYAPLRDGGSVSVYQEVASSFGVEVLRQSWRPNGQTLGTLINHEFYQNRIHFIPTPGELFGRSNLSIEVLREGIGVASARSLESPDAEVQRVVQLVMSHAMNSPEQSLLVASPSKLHVSRLKAQLANQRKNAPEFDEWFDAHGREKFEITDLETLSHRIADRIIFSIGYGANQDGFAPTDLGDLSLPSSKRLLANLLVSARNRIDIVTCFDASQVEPSEGLDALALLKQVLLGEQAAVGLETDSDPLLDDLALRLTKLGARVVSNLAGSLPLVATFGNTAAVVYPDWSLAGETLSERIRLRPALLEALGWKVVRVHSFEVFSDPQALAVRIAEVIGMQVTKRSQPLFDEASFDERPEAWGDSQTANDARLKSDKPPHWG